MRTVGEVLKRERAKTKKSLKDVSRQTRIKEKFLQALEENDFPALPSFPVALGFARNAAHALGADEELVAALLRRDFPRKDTPKKVQEMALFPRTFWTPKTTLLATALLTILVLGFYLLRQYLLFAGPPRLEIVKIISSGDRIEVQGKTLPSATVEVNGKAVLVSEDGMFRYEGARPEIGTLEVEATTRAGKSSVIKKSLVD